MAENLPLFLVHSELDVLDRFEKFINWGLPFGTANINNIHADTFEKELPYFEYSSRFIPHSHDSTKSFFLKQEFLKDGLLSTTKLSTRLLDADNFITSKNYLLFAKAYINVMIFYRNLRSKPKCISLALIYLEKALRVLNCDSNNLNQIKLITFQQALRCIQESNYSQGIKYDTGKELETLAGMLQSGHHTKTFRFSGKGFNLLDKPFSFVSDIQAKSRKKAIAVDDSEFNQRASSRISNEELAAVGLAYFKSLDIDGGISKTSFMASICGLSFTTVSMRISETLLLSRDALYSDQDNKERTRIRLTRPKIDESQNLPIPHKLSNLAKEMFENILHFSQGAHEAFKFYLAKFPNSFSEVNELYIPLHLRDIFNKEYLSKEDVLFVLACPDSPYYYFPSRLAKLSVHIFIKEPNDISNLVSKNFRKHNAPYIRIDEFEKASQKYKLSINMPQNIDKTKYITCVMARKYIGKGHSHLKISHPIFSASLKPGCYIKSKDLYNFLLMQFKQSKFMHWPYTSKDKSTKLDNALLVSFLPDNTKGIGTGNEIAQWWRPEALSGQVINAWLSQYNQGPAKLFFNLNIRLSDGSYPSITLHKTRKYHQTEALLAGANEKFIDELAGRKNGKQSEHYDLRTPHEIISQSIETFDPDVDFNVIGPVALEAPPKVKVIARKIFLYENAAPKHITEVGGCRSDWSINPCEMFGDCMRCNKSVWQKGDKKRLPIIHDMRNYSIHMIEQANNKIAEGNGHLPVKKHLQQFKDTLERCEQILAIENDATVKVGTIVTFSAPTGSFSVSELTNKLRVENCECSKE